MQILSFSLILPKHEFPVQRKLRKFLPLLSSNHQGWMVTSTVRTWGPPSPIHGSCRMKSYLEHVQESLATAFLHAILIHKDTAKV